MPRSTELTWESSERWVRASRGGVAVVDSKHPVLVWEPQGHGARYAFPVAEVREDLLRASADAPVGRHAGATDYYDLVIDGQTVPNAAWRYPAEELAGHLSFEWFAEGGLVLDRWREEDEDVFVVPRDPYHRVDPIRSSRHLRVEKNGRVLADTQRPIALFETGLPVRYYIPPEDVDFELLAPTELRTVCPYKGAASYWSLRADPNGAEAPDGEVAWAYPEPVVAQAQIMGYLSFYDSKVDVTVDGAKPR